MKIFPVDLREESQNRMPEISEREAEKNDSTKYETNHETTIETTNDKPLMILSSSSTKLMKKQKDRYQNKLEKGMFATLDQSIDEFKFASNGEPEQLRQSELTIGATKKRKALKMSPISNPTAVELIGTNDFFRKSSSHENKEIIPRREKIPNLIKVKDIANVHQFVKQVLPQNSKLICVLRKNQYGAKKLFPHFELYLNEELKFLMSCKRKTCLISSNYLIGSATGPVNETDKQYVATMKSNFSGSEYNVFDMSGDGEILATICYLNQISCKSIPREVEVFVLSPYYRCSDLVGYDEKFSLNLKIMYSMGDNKESKKIYRFVTKKPKWNEEKEIWMMDFHGRARYSSVKNMILIDEEDNNKQVLLLAKAGEGVYNLDITHPISPRAALAISSSCFDFKWVSQ